MKQLTEEKSNGDVVIKHLNTNPRGNGMVGMGRRCKSPHRFVKRKTYNDDICITLLAFNYFVLTVTASIDRLPVRGAEVKWCIP